MPALISTTKPLAAVSLSSTPGSAIWTPATGNRVRLMRGLLTSSVTGNLILTDGSGGATLAVVPVVAAGTAVAFDLGNGVLSGAINRAVYAYNSAGAATVSGVIEGSEEGY